MFGRRILGGQPDAFRMSLGYQVGGVADIMHSPKAALPPAQQPEESQESDEWHFSPEERHIETLDVEWTSDDPDPVAISRLKKSGVASGVLEEQVKLVIAVVPQDGMVNAATFQKDIQVDLQVLQIPPQLRRLEFARITPSGTPHMTLLTTLMRECALEGVTRLQCAENMLPLWEETLTVRLTTLRSLNLDSCGLASIPPAVGLLTDLRDFRASHNKLTALPHELGSLQLLHKLVADSNFITSIPVELRYCSELREISLENNRLATPVLDLRALSHLRSLQLFGNPLEFLPELSPCTGLRHLSLANVRMHSDATFTKWEVEVAPPSQSYMSRGSQPHKLASLFGLIFRRSSGQHPLLAGTLGKIAEDPVNCAVIAREVGAIQQLILMALSENEVVVGQACKTIGLLGRHNSLTSNEIIESDVLSAMLSLIGSVKHKNQLAGLAVISGLALSSEAAARKLLTPETLGCLKDLVRSGADDVKTATLETIGNLAFARANRVTFLHTSGLLAWLARLAQGQVGGVSQRSVQATATRALAILGENEEVRRAVGRPTMVDRGLRILSMDGGGMKGIAIIRLLRQLEERTGRRIYELFDLICGTSTGGILAVALALKHFTLEECEQIYRTLGQRVFLRPGGAAKEDDGWRDSLYRVYKSGQQSMRVAVYGCKHDAAMFELLLKEYCIFDQPGSVGSAMIDTACLGTPKCFVMATLASVTPAEPFLFRNYEHPLASTALGKKIQACPGSSSHQVWEAVRASSAAPYYLDDFKCGNDRFQDGAATANNPAAIAIQEARLLWPNTHIECLVSLGSGAVPPHKREKSMSAYLDTGNVLIESACSVDRVAAALATLLPLIPDLKYFRFCPVDLRCGMELDEIDPAQWALLEAATDEYIMREDGLLDACAQLLVHNLAHARSKSPDISTLRLGHRRTLLVIEAPRAFGQGAAINGHVESTAQALAKLPKCTACCRLGVEVSADVETEASGPGRGIAAVLEQHRGEVGTVHLGLHGNEQGLVTTWQERIEAVAEPGEAAAALVREAGENPDKISLASLGASRPAFEGASGSWVQLLSQQASLSHAVLLSAFLLRRVEAEQHLTAEAVASMLGCWEGQVVTTSSVIPQPLAKALLEAGAHAVVCREAAGAAADESPADVAAFFTAFYDRLFSGRPVVQALAHAGAEVPSLSGAYVCCYLLNGALVAAESYVEAAPHTGEDNELHDPGNITADSVSDGGKAARARGRSKSG